MVGVAGQAGHMLCGPLPGLLAPRLAAPASRSLAPLLGAASYTPLRGEFPQAMNAPVCLLLLASPLARPRWPSRQRQGGRSCDRSKGEMHLEARPIVAEPNDDAVQIGDGGNQAQAEPAARYAPVGLRRCIR